MLENVFPIEELRTSARSRSKAIQTKSIHPKLIDEALEEGWSVANKGKSSIRLQRNKPLSKNFEDRVWTMLYRMHFDLMSGPGGAQLALNSNEGNDVKNQLDAVAIDSEVILGLECKTSEKYLKRPQFQEELAKLGSFRERLTKAVSCQWPSTHKRPTILIFFVYNIHLTDSDRERAKHAKVSLFDEDDLDYYEKLIAHLGPAAKYQFLADVLPGKLIPGLSIKLPAVKTKMGGYNCYTFPISPEYLLKIAYVSHRAKGKASDVHTYQRMIAKNRLKSIKNYISEDGIFPTNIVVNLEKKCIDFQRGRQENASEVVDAGGVSGWLNLRPTYKSAWIIDGQHRLFAYSGHPRAKSGFLSVLAFEGIPPSTQAQLFIDINKEQKSVKQSLLQELYAELNWNSEDPSERIGAIISKTIQALGNEKDSPLYGRIQTADASKDPRRCITLASVFRALDKTFFIVKEAKSGGVLEWGPFWADNNEATMRRTGIIIKRWIELAASNAEEWWELGSAEGGGFAMNDSVIACINVLRSVLNHLDQSGLKLIRLTDTELAQAITPYGEVLGDYFGHFTPEERKRYRELRGVQGQTARTRRCQHALRSKFPTFSPAGLDDFLTSEKEQTNLRAKTIIDRIEISLKKLITDELKQEFSSGVDSWWHEGVPKGIRLEVTRRQENDDNRRGAREAYFDLIDYRVIALANWTVFSQILGFGKKNASKENQTKWIVEINDWRNQVAHASSGVNLHIDSLAQLELYDGWLKAKLSQIGSGELWVQAEP